MEDGRKRSIDVGRECTFDMATPTTTNETNKMFLVLMSEMSSFFLARSDGLDRGKKGQGILYLKTTLSTVFPVFGRSLLLKSEAVPTSARRRGNTVVAYIPAISRREQEPRVPEEARSRTDIEKKIGGRVLFEEATTSRAEWRFRMKTTREKKG